MEPIVFKILFFVGFVIILFLVLLIVDFIFKTFYH